METRGTLTNVVLKDDAVSNAQMRTCRKARLRGRMHGRPKQKSFPLETKFALGRTLHSEIFLFVQVIIGLPQHRTRSLSGFQHVRTGGPIMTRLESNLQEGGGQSPTKFSFHVPKRKREKIVWCNKWSICSGRHCVHDASGAAIQQILL